MSQPVKVGDFCKFGTDFGVIEEIGLRSTQMRTLERTVIHIPNALFASGVIENLTQRDKILYRTRLRLSYNDTPDQIKQVLTEIRRLISEDEHIEAVSSRVRFIEFGEYAQELELYIYIITRDFAEYLQYREEINLKINEIVHAVGVRLVVRESMVYLKSTVDNSPSPLVAN